MKRTLKFLAMLTCVVAIASLSACSKDNEDLIVGKWKLIAQSADNVNWQEETNDYIIITYDFRSDGTFTCVGLSGTYSIDGSTLIMDAIGYPVTLKIISITDSELIWEDTSTDENSDHRYQKLIKI